MRGGALIWGGACLRDGLSLARSAVRDLQVARRRETADLAALILCRFLAAHV